MKHLINIFHYLNLCLACTDSLPSDYRCTLGCTEFAGGTEGIGFNYCNYDWSHKALKVCVSNSTGKIKDYCQISCKSCGK